MKGKTATLIGATGLIGGHLLALLQDDIEYDFIHVLVRRHFVCDNSKVKVIVIDFSDEEAFKSALVGSDEVFCAVGTTMKKVKGDKDAYRKIDYDIPVNAARFCVDIACSQFSLVSSIGANSKSSNFYLKLKGEVEDKIKSMSIPTVSIFRPSSLLGKRQEFRLSELLLKIFIRPVSFLIPTHYKPIKADDVAKSMLEASKLDAGGINIYSYHEMKLLIIK